MATQKRCFKCNRRMVREGETRRAYRCRNPRCEDGRKAR